MNHSRTPTLHALYALTLSVTVFATTASASASDSFFAPPLSMGNRSAFTLIYFAPTAPDYTLSTGQHQWSARFDVSSHSLIENTGTGVAELDGETTRLGVSWHFRPSDRWIVSAELPLISHSGGFLDSFIDRWHGVTGLPEGQRPRQPRNRLLFGVDTDSERFELTSNTQRLGDASLNAAYAFARAGLADSRSWQSTSWVQLGVKLPTGNLNALSGSDATDVALSFHHGLRQTKSVRPLAFDIDAFVVRVGDSGLFNGQEKLHWQLQVKAAKRWARMTPEIQLRYRTRAYQSAFDVLGSDSLGVDVGVTIPLRSGYLKAGFSEDLDVDSAPDIGLFLQYTRRLR